MGAWPVPPAEVSALHFSSLISSLAKVALIVTGTQVPTGDRADQVWFVRNTRVVEAGLVWSKQGLENPRSGT